MLNGLVQTTYNINDVIIKKELLAEFQNVIETIEELVIPLYLKTIRLTERYDVRVKDTLFMSYKNTFGKVPDKKMSAVLIDIKVMFQQISDNKNKVTELIEDSFDKVTAPDQVNQKQVYIYGFLMLVSDITRFSVDFIEFFMDSFFAVNIPKGKKKYFSSGLSAFIHGHDRLSKNISVLIGEMEHQEETIFTPATIASIGVFNHQKSIASLPINEFIGNPLFHIGKFFIDRRVKKYELLAAKKEYAELRLLSLEEKLEADKQSTNVTLNSKREESIKKYRELIEELEFEMAKQKQ